MQREQMLTVTNLAKTYHADPILSVPSLQFAPGFHYFRGGNGSGKTTFFRCVAGLLPFQGEVVLDKQYEVNRDPVGYRMRVNYAEAEPLYPDFLTPRDLAGFVGRAKRSPAGQTDALIDVLGMGDFWTKPTGQFSSGMLKKTSLLLALLGTPRLVLLDEPLTTLDVETAERLFTYVRQLREQHDVSFWLTSHQDVSLTGLPLTGIWQMGNGGIVSAS